MRSQSVAYPPLLAECYTSFMRLFQRWRYANRISKAGKGFADAVGGKSKSSKERGVIRHVGELRAEAVDALAHIKGTCDSDTRKWIARNLYVLVLHAPQGDEGYSKLFALDQQMRASKDVRHFAPWLARLLVLADLVCDRAGGDGLAAMGAVAEMQGWMEHFMEENGVRGWGVPIVETVRFQSIRASRPTAQLVELTPVVDAGVRGEALAIAAGALGLATDEWPSGSLMLAATSITVRILASALKAVDKEVASLSPQEHVAVAMGLWATADATCQHAQLELWELVPLAAHTALFLNVAEAECDPEAAGVALGEEAKMLGDVFSRLQTSRAGLNAITQIGQAASDFCRTGDERFLPMLGNATLSIAPFVQFNSDSPRIRFE